MKMSKKMKQAITVAAIAGTMALSGTAMAATGGWNTATLGSASVAMNEMIQNNADIAVVAGDDGNIYYATVGGATVATSPWSEASVPVSGNINAVASQGANFFAAGDNGVVLRGGTTGQTWTKVAFPVSDKNIIDLLVTGANTAVVLTADGKLYNSTNFGNADASTVTWTARELTTTLASGGEALTVASTAAGIVSEGAGYVVYGGASALAHVNAGFTSAYNITGLSDIAVLSTANPVVKIGEFSIKGIEAAGANRLIYGSDGKMAYVKALTGNIVSPVNDDRGYVQISGLSSDITSLDYTNAIFANFTTATGEVYYMDGYDTNAEPIWMLAADVASDSLNTVITEDVPAATGMTRYRGFAAGAKGLTVWGKGLEWDESTNAAVTDTSKYIVANGASSSPTIWAVLKEAGATNLASVIRTTDPAGALTPTGPDALIGANAAMCDAGDGMVVVSDINLVTNGNAAILKPGGGSKAITQLITGASTASSKGVSYAGKNTAGKKIFINNTATYDVGVALIYDTVADTLDICEDSGGDQTASIINLHYAVNTNAESIGFTDGRFWAWDYTNDVVYRSTDTRINQIDKIVDTTDTIELLAATSVLNLDGTIDTLEHAYTPGIGSTSVYVVASDGGAIGKLYKLGEADSAYASSGTMPTAIATMPVAWGAGDLLFGTDDALYYLDVGADNIYKLVDGKFVLQGDFGTDVGDKTIDAVDVYGSGLVAGYGENNFAYTNGLSWKEDSLSLSSSTNFNSVFNATDAFYAAGDNSMLYKSTDGTSWTAVTSIVETLGGTAIDRIDGIGSVLYAYEDTTDMMYKYDGSAWERYPSTSTTLNGIVDTVITAEDTGLALTSTAIVDFADLATVKKTLSGGTANAMAMISDGTYLIVGNAGKAWSYDGTDLTDVTSNVTNTRNLNAVFKLGDTVYVAGDSGYLATYAGGVLTKVETKIASNLNNLWGYGINLFMTSADGTTYKYDGKNFFEEQAASATLNDMTGSQKLGGLVAVGNTGRILFRELGDSGLVASPLNSSNNFAYVAGSKTAQATTPNDLNATYGVDNSTLKLLGSQLGFQATITNGETATVGFSFKAADNASNTSEIGLIKLIKSAAAGEQKHYYFNATTDADKLQTQGYYWFSSTTPESDGTYKAISGELTVGSDYYIWYNIKDNGLGDSNANLGQITDPVIATTSGTGGGTSVGSSSSSGCVFNPAAGFGLEWLMLMAAPMIAVVRNRFKK